MGGHVFAVSGWGVGLLVLIVTRVVIGLIVVGLVVVGLILSDDVVDAGLLEDGW